MGQLAKTKYQVLRAFLSDETRRLVYNYTIVKRDTGQMRAPDPRIASAPRIYSDPLIEVLLAQNLPKVEAAVGTPLYPTYSYLRIHPYRAQMAAHRDRSASEVAVTINIGGDAQWPIWIKPGQSAIRIDLEPGDALLYLGREVLHWRESFPGTIQVQAMLFYVRQEGDCAWCIYDGRAGLGWPSVGGGHPPQRR